MQNHKKVGRLADISKEMTTVNAEVKTEVQCTSASCGLIFKMLSKRFYIFCASLIDTNWTNTINEEQQ